MNITTKEQINNVRYRVKLFCNLLPITVYVGIADLPTPETAEDLIWTTHASLDRSNNQLTSIFTTIEEYHYSNYTEEELINLMIADIKTYVSNYFLTQ